MFLVNTPEPTLWILEAKRHLTVRHSVVCLEASGPLACLSPPPPLPAHPLPLSSPSSSSPLSALSQNKYDDAEEQLHGYKEAAKVKFPSKSVVMVMAGHCCDDTYKALTASASGFKILRQNGTEFTLSG